MNSKYLAEYLRISDDDEDIGNEKQESDSIINQRKVLENYIENHAELSQYPVKEFVDDGVSGVDFNRPGVQRLLSEVKAEHVICIIVKDLSRFGRNYIEVGDYIEQIFPFLGVRFIAVSDNFDSFKRPAGLEIGFKNLMHDLYSRDLSKKIKSVKKLMQKKGAYSGGGVPYGYLRSREDGDTYVPDPEAAHIIRKIFLYAAEGNTSQQIADKLNKEAVPTPGVYKNHCSNANYEVKNSKCNLWIASQVGLIIRNEVYIGIYIGRKLSTVKPGEIKKNDESEYIKIKNHHESLVTEELFSEAQKAVRACRKREPYKKEERPSPLRGKVKCGCCGYSMSLKHTSKRAYYYCRMGRGCGSYNKMELDQLEESVWGIIQKFMEVYHEEQLESQSKKVKVLSVLAGMREKVRILEIQAEYCKSNRLKLYHQWREGRLTKEEYMNKKDELTEKESEDKKELERLKHQMENIGLVENELEERAKITTVMDAKELTKDLVDELIERIDVYNDDRVEIKWRFCEKSHYANL